MSGHRLSDWKATRDSLMPASPAVEADRDAAEAAYRAELARIAESAVTRMTADVNDEVAQLHTNQRNLCAALLGMDEAIKSRKLDPDEVGVDLEDLLKSREALRGAIEKSKQRWESVLKIQADPEAFAEGLFDNFPVLMRPELPNLEAG